MFYVVLLFERNVALPVSDWMLVVFVRVKLLTNQGRHVKPLIVDDCSDSNSCLLNFGFVKKSG